MSLVGFIALDPQLLRRCSREERFFAVGVSIVAFLNGMFIALAAFFSMQSAGQSNDVSGYVACAASLWFLALQHLLLQLHGEHRAGLATGVSKLFCILFLSFFVALVSIALFSAATTSSLVTNTPLAIEAAVVFIAFSFLFPLYARGAIVQAGNYGILRDRELRMLIERWDKEFVPRYRTYVKATFGLVDYDLPPEMLASAAITRDRKRRTRPET